MLSMEEIDRVGHLMIMILYKVELYPEVFHQFSAF